MLASAVSAGLFFLGVLADGAGCGSLEVDRFASASVDPGVDTGGEGARLLTGFLPAQPAKTLAQKNVHAKTKNRCAAARRAAFRAIPLLPSTSRKLPARKLRFVFRFPEPSRLRRICASA